MTNTGNFFIDNPLRPVLELNVSSVNGGEQRTVKTLVDTGAMRSFISSDVAKELKLKSESAALITGATSKTMKKIRLCKINIHFPFNLTLKNVTVGKMDGIIKRSYDFVIGMDIISKGDMLITNTEGQMCISFRFPPSEEREIF